MYELVACGRVGHSCSLSEEEPDAGEDGGVEHTWEVVLVWDNGEG